MNLHITKAVEIMIDSFKHMVIGFEFELKYRRHPRGLDELMEAIDDVYCDAKKVKMRHHSEIRENRFLKCKLNGIIEDLVELRKAVYDKKVNGERR